MHAAASVCGSKYESDRLSERVVSAALVLPVLEESFIIFQQVGLVFAVGWDGSRHMHSG